MSEVDNHEEFFTRSDIIYKLGQIESKIETNSNNWAEPVRQIKELLERLEKNIANDFSSMKADVKLADARITKVEEDLHTWKVRGSTALAGVAVLWAALGDTFSHFIERILQ